MKKKKLVTRFEIYVPDIIKAREFYQDVFKIKLTKFDVPEDSGVEAWMFPKDKETGHSPGMVIQIIKGQPINESNRATIRYWAENYTDLWDVSNMDKVRYHFAPILHIKSEDFSELDRVESFGGKVMAPKTKNVDTSNESREDYIATISDPWGNVLALISNSKNLDKAMRTQASGYLQDNI